ncbi:MAG: class I SAM-dependent methyltransferase [Phycisphaeraceae bacterium]|nr:class I SAM-dependent methyltransferase [Phycisphaeraceae bacterium]
MSNRQPDAVRVLDRFDCYELCVQSPRHVAPFLRAVHGNHPIRLREDFCGTAALSRYWLEDALRLGEKGRALAVDLDPVCIERAGPPTPGALELVVADCRSDDAGDTTRREPADIVFVGNFSIGYLHSRAELMRYLRASRERLVAGGRGGIFVCDTYGGTSAYKLGSLTRKHPSPTGEIVHYHWAHEAADPLTGMVTNSISFRVERAGEIVQELPRAFVYNWRLWPLAELREAMIEVGFGSTQVYTDCNVAPDEMPVPVGGAAELKDDWIVLIVARV